MPYFQAYRRAEPITQWPLKKVRHSIPELKGIEPAADQSGLPEILRGVSANLQKFVVNFVDTTAVENIDEAETPPYWGRFEPYAQEQSTKRIRQKFDYLILRHPEGGAFNLVEYRTEPRGQKKRHRELSTDFIKTAGFAAMPLFFGSLQQPWSEFRYLGRQKIGGVDTEVVAFAEHADRAAVMGHFLLGRTIRAAAGAGCGLDSPRRLPDSSDADGPACFHPAADKDDGGDTPCRDPVRR